MASRLYLGSVTAPDVSPAFDAGWERTDAAIRRQLKSAPSVAEVMTDLWPFLMTPSASALAIQLVGQPMAAGILIPAQTVMRAQILAEANLQDTWANIGIRIVSGNGLIVRDTNLPAIQAFGSVLGTVEPENRSFVGTTSLLPYTTVAGDRLVVEFGASIVGVDPRDRFAGLTVGASAASDLPENETETGEFRPWFQLDDVDLVYLDEVPGVALSGRYQPTMATAIIGRR